MEQHTLKLVDKTRRYRQAKLRIKDALTQTKITGRVMMENITSGL